MNQRLLSRLSIGLFLLLPLAKADVWTVTLEPSPNISGAPGQTIGWDYQITNDSSTDWLVLNSVSGGVFLNGTPDSSVFDYPIVGPGATVDGPLFNLTWDLSAPIGFMNSGTFDLTADWWSSNPLVDPSATDLGPAADGFADYTATVSGVPEPSSVALAFPPLVLMGWMVWRRRAKPVRVRIPA